MSIDLKIYKFNSGGFELKVLGHVFAVSIGRLNGKTDYGFEIVDLPIKHMLVFHGFPYVM